jgi:integrase
MATPKKTAQGTWRVQIEIKGVRESHTALTKREASEWAARRATEIRTVKAGKVGTLKTLRDALRQYAQEVSPTKRGEKWEILRLAAMERQALPMGRVLSSVTVDDLIAWRDSRLAVVARGSVLREMTLLGTVLEHARREWRWIESNPMRDVRRPANPDHRSRVITGPEVRKMLRALGYSRAPVRTVSHAVALAFLFALATGMRAGEICAVEWPDVRGDHVVLHTSKTGQGRQVPLSPVAQRLLERAKGWDAVQVFGLQSQTLDALFRRARARAGLAGFVFHDSRHTAATRIGRMRLLDVLELCRMFGWRDPKMAMVYFNASASQIAARFTGAPPTP